MEETIEKLNQRIREIERETAERKPVSELIKLLIYFLFAISIVLGLFGLKQFSDLDELVSEQVKLQLPRDKQQFHDYEKLIDKTIELDKNYNELFGKYKEALNNFSSIDKVSDSFDIEGKVERLIHESTERYKKSFEGGYEGTILEEEWRAKAISILTVLSEAQKNQDFESDLIFNAAQAAGRLKLSSLQLSLMKVAHQKRPNDAPIKAGYLSSVVDAGLEDEVEDAYAGLLDMVRHLSINSPHIVLAEAWNASEDRRDYGALVDAISDLVEKENAQVKPSYAYALMANALLRSSRPGDLARAKNALEKAKKTFLSETTHSVWATSTLEQVASAQQQIELTELMHEGLNIDMPIIKSSGTHQ